MKRYNNLFEKIVNYENMLSALKKALKGAGRKNDSNRYWFEYERKILELIERIKKEKYCPKKYRSFKIYEPKERVIHIADFEDRIVHHAIVNILEKIYEKRFIYDSYATRKGKGVHKAVYRAQYYLKNNKYFLKSDIRKYFDSIDQKLLLGLIKKKVKCTKTIGLIGKILFNYGNKGKGLPIGNLTSQFFANVYLDVFDHYIKDQNGFKYIRYMDDFVIFSNEKDKLKKILIEIREYLEKELELDLKDKVTFINKRENGLSFLGRRIYNAHIKIKRENFKRSIKKINRREYEYYYDLISEEKLQESIWSIYSYIYGYRKT